MNKLQALKCFEVTSQTQADNGTICYHDPITNCDYLSYENGYIRRAYTRKYITSAGYKYQVRNIYQLNPQKRRLRVLDENFSWTETERIMIPKHEDRIEKLTKAVVNFRKHIKKLSPDFTYN